MAIYQSTHTGPEIDEAIGKVSTIEQSVITNTEDITTLEEAVTTINEEINTINEDLTALNSNISTHISDATKHIDNTTEFSGAIDETNDKFTIWDNSLLKWIKFSFSSIKTWLNSLYPAFGGNTFGVKKTIGSTDNQDFGIITNNTERVTILKNGNVGLGTTNPLAKLHLVDGNVCFSGDSQGGATINPAIYNIMIGPKQARLGIGNYMPGIAFNHLLNYNGSPTYDTYAQAWIGTRVTNVAGSELADLVFATKTTTGIEPGNYATEKMTITSAGNVGIGTTTPKSKLQVVGGIQCGDDTAAASADKVGTIRYRSTANASYVEMCMKTGSATYAWQTILTNTW